VFFRGSFVDLKVNGASCTGLDPLGPTMDKTAEARGPQADRQV
jgi:hypothetical protein